MAYLDESTIQAIRKRHPIQEIVERYVTLTKKGDDYWGLCPFHADNHASMSVSVRLDMFQCFSCKKAGNIFNFIAGIENITYAEAIQKLASEDGYIINSVKRVDSRQKDYEVMNLAIKYYQNNIHSNLAKNAIEYLEKRSIDRKTIQKFELGLSISKQPLTTFLKNKYDINVLIDLGLATVDERDVFKDRIMVPIHDTNGNPIGFGGRVYQTKEDSKYINTKKTRIFDKSTILYNYHRAHNKLTKNDSIIIMEGYFDVIRASVIGVDNCVAPMGTSLTKQHIHILKKITNHIILCFDGDEAGKNATLHAISLLENMNMDTKIVRLEEKDPDEFIIKRGREAFLEKINHPMNIIDFKMQYLSEDKNLNDLKETSVYIDEVLKELIKEDDSILVELTLKKIASRFKIEYDTLKLRLKEYQSKFQINDKKSNYEVNILRKIPDRYGQAIDNLLYYMSISPEVIELAEPKVSFIVDDKKRRLYNEIIYYDNKYGKINLADFITYLEMKTNVADTFMEILNLGLKESYTKEEIDDYIKCVNDYFKKIRIDNLKLELKREVDPLKQASILSEMMKIRGVNTSD